jgi:uncharacterized sulfatase
VRRGARSSILAVASLVFASCAPEPPNILLIIGDDHGYTDFGLMGSTEVHTPRLDRLAGEGILFSHGYVTASVCRPSLRSLLTGLHPYQWDRRIEQLRQRGIERDPAYEILDFDTLPDLLGRAGYTTFQAGKLWEANYEIAGFDEGTAQTEAQTRDDWRQIDLDPTGRDTMQPVYDFIERHREQPFFVWFAPVLPHVPWDAPERYTKLYAAQKLSVQSRAYYANISRFDDVVGGLLDYLDELGLTRETLVVYLVDNGWDQRPDAKHRPLPGGGPKGKFSMHELGFRTPIILRWPERFPGGAVVDALVSSVDLVPTLLDYAGVDPPAYLPGQSLRALLEGRGAWSRTAVFGGMDQVRVEPSHRVWFGYSEFRGPAFFLRTNGWHYIWYVDRDHEQLFRPDTDPRETRNLASEHPAEIERFRAAVDTWQSEMAAPFSEAALGQEIEYRPLARSTSIAPPSGP